MIFHLQNFRYKERCRPYLQERGAEKKEWSLQRTPVLWMYSTTKLHIACRAGVILASECSVCGSLWQRKAGERKRFYTKGAVAHERSSWLVRLSSSCQSQTKCVIWTCYSCGKMRKMASTVNCKVLRSDSAFEEALKCRSEFNLSRALKSQQREVICTLVYGKDLQVVLPTGFKKSLIFRVLVRMKEIMPGKSSSEVVVFPLQSIFYDHCYTVSLEYAGLHQTTYSG